MGFDNYRAQDAADDEQRWMDRIGEEHEKLKAENIELRQALGEIRKIVWASLPDDDAMMREAARILYGTSSSKPGG